MDFQSEKSFGKLRLRAFQPYHQILCMSKHVEDVEDRSNTLKGYNAMYVEACRRCRRWEKNIQTYFYHTFLNMVSFECNPMYVEDVEDGSKYI